MKGEITLSFAHVPMFVKMLIEIILAFVYIFSFNKLYGIMVNNIYSSIKESSASDTYSLMKIASTICLVLNGLFFIIMNASTHKLFFNLIELFILIFMWGYSKSSLNLMDHLVSYLYRPELLNDESYAGFVGVVEESDGVFTFKHYLIGIELPLQNISKKS